MSRDPESVLLEAEYWKHVNLDVGAISDDIGEIASSLSTAVVEHGLAAIQVAFKTTEREQANLEASLTAMKAAMDRLAAMQGRVAQLGELVGGRINVIADELHGETP